MEQTLSTPSTPQPATTGRAWLLVSAAVVAWLIAYNVIQPLADWLTYGLLGLARGSHLGDSLAFFLYDVPKILLLLSGMIFAITLLRSFFSPERTRALLGGRREGVGNVFAAGLGVLTPFCSCSAVPLFIGFVESGIPLGVTFSFLIAAPMVNEVALVMLFGMFGWQVAGLYLISGLSIAMVAGLVIGRLKMERYVEDFVWQIKGGGGAVAGEHPTWTQRFAQAWESTREIVGKVWLYVVVGIAVGAGIHGYVPDDALAEMMGSRRLVVGAGGGADRGAALLERGGDDPGGAGADGQGRGAGHGAGLHDGRRRPEPARDDHPAPGAQAAPDRHLRRRGRAGDHRHRLPVQPGDLSAGAVCVWRHAMLYVILTTLELRAPPMLTTLLERSAELHRHLCPRQVLGARMGMYAGARLGLELPRRSCADGAYYRYERAKEQGR